MRAGSSCPGAYFVDGYRFATGVTLKPLEYRILHRGRRASGRLCRDIGLFEPTPEKPETGCDTVASSPKEGMDGKTLLSSDAAYDDDVVL